MKFKWHYVTDSVLACVHQLLHSISIYFAVFFVNHLPEEVIRKTNEFVQVGNAEAVCYNATRVAQVLGPGDVGYGVNMFTKVFGLTLAVVYTIMPFFNLLKYWMNTGGFKRDRYFPRFASLHYAYLMGKQPRVYSTALYTYLVLQWAVALFGLNSCKIFPEEYKCLTREAKWFLGLQMVVATLGFLSTVREPLLWRVHHEKLREASKEIIFTQGFFCFPKLILFLLLQSPQDRVEHIENGLMMLRSGAPELARHQLTFKSGDLQSMYDCITFRYERYPKNNDEVAPTATENP